MCKAFMYIGIIVLNIITVEFHCIPVPTEPKIQHIKNSTKVPGLISVEWTAAVEGIQELFKVYCFEKLKKIL